MGILLDEARRILAAQPFSVLLGAELDELEEGRVELALPVTSEYKINYVRPAIGEVLIAKATVVAAGRRQAVCRCDVLVRQDGEEKLCAVAQGTIARLEGQASRRGEGGRANAAEYI